MKRNKKQHLFRGDGGTFTPVDGTGGNQTVTDTTNTDVPETVNPTTTGTAGTVTTKQLADALRSATTTTVYRPLSTLSSTTASERDANLTQAAVKADLTPQQEARLAEMAEQALAEKKNASLRKTGSGEGGSTVTAHVGLKGGLLTPAPEPVPEPEREPAPEPEPEPAAAPQGWTFLGVTMKPLYWLLAAVATLIATAVTVKYLTKE